MSKKINKIFFGLCLLVVGQYSIADAVTRQLALPENEPTALQVAQQVYFANHFYAFENFSISKKGRSLAVLMNKSEKGKLSVIALERYLNNRYEDDDVIKSKDLAIFKSGKLKGTGMLVADYDDADKSQSYLIWLPALRKIRRFAEPAHDETWGGSVFTFGDVTLRKPSDESHELLGKKKFRTCLGTMTDVESEHVRYAGKIPKRSCRHIGKTVYGLKSTAKSENWWYDYRISLVDTKSFADYRTLFYKDGKLMKIIDRDWGVVNQSNTRDPRALFWKSWYGINLDTGQQTLAIIPQEVIKFNTDQKNSFWSEKTLRRIKR